MKKKSKILVICLLYTPLTRENKKRKKKRIKNNKNRVNTESLIHNN